MIYCTCVVFMYRRKRSIRTLNILFVILEDILGNIFKFLYYFGDLEIINNRPFYFQKIFLSSEKLVYSYIYILKS